KEISERFMNFLRLRTLPVGVKLLKDPKELPIGCEILDEPLTFCQFVTYARVYGRTLGVSQENLVCAIAKGNLGFADFPAGLAKRFAIVRTSTGEAFEKILKTGLRIEPGRFQAALVAPLEAIPIDPDVILLFADGAQMTRLIYASTYQTGERLNINTAAECGTCGEGAAAAFMKDKPTVSFPCYGTRRFALAEDNELIFSFPCRYSQEILKGLEITQKGGFKYPILRQISSPKPPALYRIRDAKPPEEYFVNLRKLEEEIKK
ncbi:MAG: DUF169 domain-containing protein, partial [Thermodesulfobacteriota bacterium]|nr:DUF169 domain-containing protein [Thermodesulfobacteriota bacterium]